MSYKYITSNNLFDKQNYMYSEYKGMEFLRDFLDSRQTFINMDIEQNDYTKLGQEQHGKTNEMLKRLLDIVKENGIDLETKHLIDMFVKTFEVRKRIYNKYDVNWKPIGDIGFEDYENYIVLSEILGITYESTKCLKYFSCMLKVDDTLLSIADVRNLSMEQIERVKGQIRKELGEFFRLSAEQGIYMRDE